jgi:predicted DsbA family dithiol-disulfide isomerase
VNADVRLRRLESEYAGRVELEFRAFLLRPEPRGPFDGEEHRARALERFRLYTSSWERVAADPDAGELRVWASDEGPPSHSIPPHLVAKAAARLGNEAFRRMHERLLRAYFVESRDISDLETLRSLWRELDLAEGGFDAHCDPAIRREVLAEHAEAIELGATGVPAVRLAGNDAVIVGAQPVELYRRWIERALSRPTPAPGILA